MTIGNPDSYCKRVAMASPNLVATERNMKDKDIPQLAAIKNSGEECAFETIFISGKNYLSECLFTSNAFAQTRLFWG